MKSIFSQTLTDWELVVCDSFSDDGTWEYLQQFKDDSRVRLYQVPREGLYLGWNECLTRCRGEYVYFAPADDTMQPECLEKMVAALDKVESRKSKVEIETEETGGQSSHLGLQSDLQPSEQRRPVDICACGYYEVDSEGREKIPEPAFPESLLGADLLSQSHVRSGKLEFLLHALFCPTWVTMTAVMFRRALLASVPAFPIQFGSAGDLAWALLACAHTDVLWIPEPLGGWRKHPQQATACSSKLDREYAVLRVVRFALAECNDWVTIGVNEDLEFDWHIALERPIVVRIFRMLGLTRHQFRSHPFLFVRNYCKALRMLPRETLHYSRCLFSYSAWLHPSLGDPDDLEGWAKRCVEHLGDLRELVGPVDSPAS